jgi:hypothetical protein
MRILADGDFVLVRGLPRALDARDSDLAPEAIDLVVSRNRHAI